MQERWRAWGERPFRLTTLACVQFVVLSAIAMLLYPGGSRADPASGRYSFFNNFFSDLGLTTAINGAPNTASMILFIIGLTVAGLGLVLFFVTAPQFFQRERFLRVLSALGSLFGALSGLCFIGVAWSPANLAAGPHGQFTLWAFQTFLVVVVFYVLAILLSPRFPNVYALVYFLFAVLLAGYIVLMMRGPGLDTAQGVSIQATGQKLIVYAAILCMFIQARGAARLRRMHYLV
jgi:hypothetical protein